MAFTEITITNGSEVMINVDTDDGTTISIYTYLDDIPFLTDNERSWIPAWVPGDNSLFGHLRVKDFDRFASCVIESGFMLSSSDIDEIKLDIENGVVNPTVLENPIIKSLIEDQEDRGIY